MADSNNRDRPAAKDAPRAPIDVAIADKNPLILAGLTQIFGEDGRFNLVALCSDGERFMDALNRFSIDVGVIGWVMPFGDGRFVLDRLRERAQAPRIIVYTGSDEGVAALAMNLGAAGFCAKSEAPSVLLETIATVASGRMVFPFMDVRETFGDPLSSLTNRERQMLAAIATGLSNAEIAGQQGISPNTVKFHLGNLYDKMHVKNRTQAVAHYLKR